MNAAQRGPANARGVRCVDVCNGDADGLCSVVQWRLHHRAEATLVTGLKRDIALLEHVDAAAGDEVLVCDLSMERNREALERLLARGVRVRYFDHHASGAPIAHALLEAHLDASSAVCTSVLVDRHLGGRHRAWAAAGAYGDNLLEVGDALATSIGLANDERDRLRRLGEAINYNAYGDDESDLLIAPADLYRKLVRYEDPLRFVDCESVADELVDRRRADLRCAAAQATVHAGATGSVHVLPDAPWSRRVIGSLANELALAEPARAHAVLRPAGRARYVASVRAPLREPAGAGTLCAGFGGSGRAAAGGIDALAATDLERFVREFVAARWGEPG